MSVQNMLTGLLTHARTGAEAEKEAREILALHAHELAEKIRTELPERVKKLTGNWAEIRTVSTAQHAADLIDPKKEGQ